MSELRKLSYNPDEVDSSEEGELRSASDETATETSSGTEDTESVGSQDSGTDKELEIRKSPNPPVKLYNTSLPGTPGLSLHQIASPEGSGPDEQSTEERVQVKHTPQVSAISQMATADSIIETPTLKIENAEIQVAKQLLSKEETPEKHKIPQDSLPEDSDPIQKLNTTSGTQRCKIAKRVMDLPIVQSALDVFNIVEQIPLIGWFAYCARMQCRATTACLNVVVSPCLNQCGPLVSNMDNSLDIVLNVAEKVFPCMKMTPQQIVGSTARCTVDCLCYVPRSLCCLAGPCRPKEKDQ